MTAITDDTRQRVARRATYRCEYCHLPQACQVATFPVDHVTPRCQGGKTELSNLAMACPRCNALKWIHTRGPDPETGEQVELFDPRKHIWSEHLAWSSTEPTRIQPRTAIGRATVAFLELNGTRRVEIRGWLASLGVHPPE